MSDSTQLNILEDNDNFINDLIEITRKEDKELQGFIEEKLSLEKSTLSIEHINKNIESLRGMNNTQQALVKARARKFEEMNDPSKHLPILLALFGLVISLYNALIELPKLLKSESILGVTIVLNIAVIAGLALYANWLYRHTVKMHPTAVFFDTLINSIKFEDQ
ncbi:hypothetical protein [Tissierella creatinophila]|uniref:Uncharacterized protein n=1 Tax=Tissierella creatinophila DSM 6911 TaxID=1123403 RepID=A0A1U7M6C5_TISCR|nr:hypothetical protein [Tissierella creatinophila]OLS02872.1 hypothetical protein TICRE_11450 [Tissierella creatinophila DSM 6911]